MKKEDGAFPVFDGGCVLAEGMSKRFYAACAAMQSIINSQLTNEVCLDALKIQAKNLGISETSLISNMAYGYADELLKQENE